MNSPKKIWYAPHKFEAYGQEEIKAVNDCLNSGWLAPGPLTEEFEKQIALKFDKKFACMVNSGSSANTIALLCAGCGPGIEIVTPACTFSTCVAPMVQLGAKIVFCDSELQTYVPSSKQIIDKMTENTRIVFIPNLLGNIPDWKKIKEDIFTAGFKDVTLIEDSCDTIIAGPYSDISVTSFYASHVITAGGGGGMVMFNDQKQLALALQYRDWGRIGNNIENVDERFGTLIDGIPYDFKFLYGVLGYNFKSTEMNAAFGLAQLKKLDQFLSKRRSIVERYLENLKNTSYMLPDDSYKPNWLAFPLMIKNRMKLLQLLEDNNIQTRVCMAGNITRHPAYRQYLEAFPNADKIMAEAFLVGAHHGLELEDVDRVCDLLKSFDSNNN